MVAILTFSSQVDDVLSRIQCKSSIQRLLSFLLSCMVMRMREDIYKALRAHSDLFIIIVSGKVYTSTVQQAPKINYDRLCFPR